MKIQSILLFSMVLFFSCSAEKQSTENKISFPDFGRTSLIKAVIEQDENLTIDLARNNRYINQQDWFGMSALLYAAAAGNERMFRTLLQNGADLKQTDQNNESVVHKFAQIDFKAPYTYLKLHGLSLETSTKQGATPLHIAAKNWNFYALETLLQNGVTINLQDFEGKTALHRAIEHFPDPDSATIAALKNPIADSSEKPKKNYWILTKQKAKDVINSIKIFFLNFPKSLQSKPKPLLNKQAGVKVVELLLDYQADPHLRDNNMETPLDIAKKKKDYSLIKVLVNRGLLKETDF